MALFWNTLHKPVVTAMSVFVAAFAAQLYAGSADSGANSTETESSVLIAPSPYEAAYEARARGLSTEAYRNLEETGDNVYRLSHGLSLRVLGANLISVTETSHFYWQDSGAVPVSYAFEQSGLRKREETIQFDWENASASVTRDDRQSETAIRAGLLDNLSFTAQMSAQLNANPDLLETGTTLEYQILDGTEPETHEYRVVDRENVDTLAGSLDTLLIERVRDPDSDRSTRIWLAVEHAFVLAKLEQIEDGDRTELLLASLNIGDTRLGVSE
ncbi:hypothetical protein PHACT_13460 [Pseudohongiella acticola]|jgi:Protein of unknown function (DUF3108)|uniref:DUF3108 domain-containing protein n=1 Tax=Pseudohongiella acticola TaxID=1524254 RepID=A0A1E8CGK1_9GAMM|nr:DUF3108 domain-containing protein [Pseudohongiella acticola]OFE11543.1 hypothetical protein PHACT_13460 [Pseudohongiella acticola]